jgi:protein O-mannosyl-transferase
MKSHKQPVGAAPKERKHFKGQDKTGNGAAFVMKSWRVLWLAVILFGLVLGVFYPITRGDFINYDDDVYVTANYHVQHALSTQQLVWAFTNVDAANWHPLTWLSHIMDFQLYGMKPGGHHFTSVALHALNTVLLFVVMRMMTGAVWRSVAVALLFGLHPLRVESVAWISERKDVLSGTFWLLAMWAYTRYAQGLKIEGSKFKIYYGLALGFFICGLMSKPMAVTLPFVLLVMDWWPLDRIHGLQFAILGLRRDKLQKENGASKSGMVSLAWAVSEKIPFMAGSAAGCLVTYLAQKRQGAVTELFSLGYRMETALVAYARYVEKFFYPANLAVLYPHPKDGWPLVEITAAAILLAGVTVAVMAGRRSHPYELAGWLWFMGTLVPVIGFVQVGSQSMADRYMYLPGIGLNIMVVWGVCELAQRANIGSMVLIVAGAAAVIFCAALTEHQIMFWKNSGTLFQHALAVTENNYQARKALGDFYWSQGDMHGAVTLYREAIQMAPKYEGAHINLGAVLNATGHPAEAAAEFEQAIALNPNDASAYNDLGAVIATRNFDGATTLFRKATELDPNYADAWKNLGRALDQKGEREEAMADYRLAIALRPDAEAHYFLAMDLAQLGRTEEAMREFTKALKVQPDYENARRALKLLESGGKP